MAKPLENRDITLLTIAAADSTGLTPVQLMKSVFLIGESGLPDLPSDFYPFFAYDYGPFHPDVYRDVETLISEGLVLEVREAGQNWSNYVVAQAGLQRASTLRGQVDSKFSKYIDAVVNWVKPLTFDQLLQAIYAKYPKMRENSVFQGV